MTFGQMSLNGNPSVHKKPAMDLKTLQKQLESVFNSNTKGFNKVPWKVLLKKQTIAEQLRHAFTIAGTLELFPDTCKHMFFNINDELVSKFTSFVKSTTCSPCQSHRILIVGAGGIGCEVIKCLAVSGYKDLTIIDLDTIDLSNLNRQLLFRKEHVGKPKAEVAAQAVLEMRSDIRVKALQCNIMDPEFGPGFFGTFDIVLSALDNVQARRHVNRMCLVNKVPLIESGTGGYAGQVKAILGGSTECFECNADSSAGSQKVYPVCTIRNTPDKPIHCIVWAKAAFLAMFGSQEDKGHNIMSDLKLPENSEDSLTAEKVFRKLFHQDIVISLKETERWKHRKAPIPLILEELWDSSVAMDFDAQSVPNGKQSAWLFMHSFSQLLKERSEEIGEMTFSKDDDLVMNLVSAMSNLRMLVFHIPPQSPFQIKGMAGNIIHAIATTNAIAAGLVVAQASTLLSSSIEQCRMVWIGRVGPHVLSAEKLTTPSPNCFVCADAAVQVFVDVDVLTLEQFYENVLMGYFGMIDPDVDIVELSDRGYLGMLEDIREEPCRGSLPLSSNSIGIKHDTLVSVTEGAFEGTLHVKVHIQHCSIDLNEHPNGFIIKDGTKRSNGSEDVSAPKRRKIDG